VDQVEKTIWTRVAPLLRGAGFGLD
jgi:hypothetical protein